MTARYDKYDSENGGFRAPLNANISFSSQAYGPIGVGINSTGKVVPGKSNSGIVGVLVKNMPSGALIGNVTLTGITAPGGLAGDMVDVMTKGEIYIDEGDLTIGAYWADGTNGNIVAGQAGGAAPGSGDGSSAGSKLIGFARTAHVLVVVVGL